MSVALPGPVRGSLADLVPSVLADLGVRGFAPGALGRVVPAGTRAVCVLLVDGMGWRLLAEHAAQAPFLSGLAGRAGRAIAAGFPTTTAASIASLGSGVPSGQHGIVGYSFTVDGMLLQPLSWTVREGGQGIDARELLVPEVVQPVPTALERAAAAGVRVRLAVPGIFRGSGLTRAALRGGELVATHALGDLAAAAVAGLTGAGPALSYAYHGDLDLLGHVYGPGSEPWLLQLAHVDRLAAAIADRLPPGAALVVTADHGMVHVPPESRVDLDTTAALQAGVRLVGGEPRARYLYTEPGALADVRAAWTEVLGDRAWIVDTDEAVAAGWYGPAVADRVRARIGDLVVAARSDVAVTRSSTEPTLSRLLGHHGSLTPEEQLVPVLVAG
jgi:predicted AlkP superfamily pyrophosphatase or phosphodiesterase